MAVRVFEIDCYLVESHYKQLVVVFATWSQVTCPEIATVNLPLPAAVWQVLLDLSGRPHFACAGDSADSGIGKDRRRSDCSSSRPCCFWSGSQQKHHSIDYSLSIEAFHLQ